MYIRTKQQFATGSGSSAIIVGRRKRTGKREIVKQKRRKGPDFENVENKRILNSKWWAVKEGDVFPMTRSYNF